jgi:hypothetical protein
MTKREFEQKTFGWKTSEPIPTTRVLKKRHRYRESRDRTLNEDHHARLEDGRAPSDWWGLYGSEKHRKEVLRKDIQRHMVHEFKNIEGNRGATLSPEKLLGGERQMRAIQNHMSRMALKSTEGIPHHDVTKAHNPDYKSARDHEWATHTHDYLKSTEAWKGHLKAGLSRHEDPTQLLLKGSQHFKAAGDATAGTMWRGQLQREKYSQDQVWVPTKNLHSRSALAHKTTKEQRNAIEERYKELLAQTYESDNVVTHARGVESWYQNVGNEGRRIESSPSRTSPKKTSSLSSPAARMLSPKEREQRRLELARSRAERSNSFKGLTKEEALRVGNASNTFRKVDWKKEREEGQIKMLSPQEREQRRLELARSRAERNNNSFEGLTKEEALRVGNASNTFRKVDWEKERNSSPSIKVLSPQEREHQRLVQAAARARRHEREGGDYHGIKSAEKARKVGEENNYASPKGVTFDISFK